jgi:collagen type XII alpha
LGFLIDGSSTVGEDNFRLELDFAYSIFENFWTHFGSIKVGVVVFGKESKLAFDFENQYSEKISIKEAIDSISYPSGESFLGSALQATKGGFFLLTLMLEFVNQRKTSLS